MINSQIVSDALKKELGSFFSTEAHRTNDIIRYINSAIRAICFSKNFNFNKYTYQLTTDVNNTTYTIPFQVETFFILDASGTQIQYATFENYYKATNKASIMWIWDTTLVTDLVWTYTIYYRWFPTTITTIPSNINIPEHFFDLIVLKASEFAYMDIADYQKAAEKRAIYTGMMIDVAKRHSDTMPLKTKVVNYSNNTIW